MDKKTMLHIFSNTLKRIQKHSCQNSQEFADSCDISSVYTLHNYLYGKSMPPINTVIKICEVHHISVNMLFTGIVDHPTEQTALQVVSSFLSQPPGEMASKMLGVITPLLECMAKEQPYLGKSKYGARIKILREDCGFSKNDFAEMCGIKVGTLKSHESEQRYPGSEIFLNYCRVLCVSPGYLLCNNVTQTTESDCSLFEFTPRQIASIFTSIEKICDFSKKLSYNI